MGGGGGGGRFGLELDFVASAKIINLCYCKLPVT